MQNVTCSLNYGVYFISLFFVIINTPFFQLNYISLIKETMIATQYFAGWMIPSWHEVDIPESC